MFEQFITGFAGRSFVKVIEAECALCCVIVGDQSAIEWTDATWNPVAGCTKISPGGKHCYAERLAARLHAMACGAPRHSERSEESGSLAALDVKGGRRHAEEVRMHRRKLFLALPRQIAVAPPLGTGGGQDASPGPPGQRQRRPRPARPRRRPARAVLLPPGRRTHHAGAEGARRAHGRPPCPPSTRRARGEVVAFLDHAREQGLRAPPMPPALVAPRGDPGRSSVARSLEGASGAPHACLSPAGSSPTRRTHPDPLRAPCPALTARGAPR